MKVVKPHGFWAIAMVAAFFVGMAWQKSATADSQKSKTQDQASLVQSSPPALSETGGTDRINSKRSLSKAWLYPRQ
jgi:hypothetical protein